MTQYSGLFSDGQSAAAHDVHVRLVDSGVEISSSPGELLAVWDYDKLTSISPLQRGFQAQVGYKDLPSATLFVADPMFASDILDRTGHLSHKAENVRLLVPMIAAAVFLIGMVAFFSLTSYSIMAEIARFIPKSTRAQIGTNVVDGIISGKKICAEPEGIAALNKIKRRLQRGLKEPREFDVRVARLGMVNAFAAPGEQIIFAGELIKKAGSPEEVAGVLAHEMGHGLKLHPEAGVLRSIGISAAFMLLAGGDPGTSAGFGNMLLQLNYRRQDEREADRIAVQLLKKAEISAKPLSDFFARLKSEEDDDDKDNNSAPNKLRDVLSPLGNLLSTHPGVPERVQYIEKQPDWPTRPLLSSSEWKALQSVCGPDRKKEAE